MREKGFRPISPAREYVSKPIPRTLHVGTKQERSTSVVSFHRKLNYTLSEPLNTNFGYNESKWRTKENTFLMKKDFVLKRCVELEKPLSILEKLLIEVSQQSLKKQRLDEHIGNSIGRNATATRWPWMAT